MFRFINEQGKTFAGLSPYIHWIEGQLSTGIWHTLKLMIISDTQTLTTSTLGSDSIFKFIDPQYFTHTDEVLDLDTISKRQITSTGESVSIEGTTYYIHQILMVCCSNVAGEYIDTFKIDGQDVSVGVDVYDLDETLEINLSNRGLELPESIEKAFLGFDINEDLTDNALINRKFKELISNFIDVVDNKGSYKSLYNSLKWFEWGENTKLYEIWQGNDGYFEKELQHILSEEYMSLLYTHRKTTHLALVTALQDITDNIDEERNPVLVDDIPDGFSAADLALKISILGAFFERYFMPIHLDLKRACVEALIYTNQVKCAPGTLNGKYHFWDDTGVVDVSLNRTVTLGNIEAVSTGPKTMFGVKVSDMQGPSVQYINPVGVDLLNNIGDLGEYIRVNDFNNDFGIDFSHSNFPVLDYTTEYSSDSAVANIATFWLQLKGGVGTVVPVTVTIDLPNGDALNTEVITISRDNGPLVQVTDHKLITPINNKATFTFNLLSTKEETVEFTLNLFSVSGHSWNAKAGYKCIDTKGSYLDIYKVGNRTFNTMDEWVSNNRFVPYQSQFNIYGTSIDPKMILQYIPYNDETTTSLFHQLIVVQNPEVEGEYDSSWITDAVRGNFWVIERSGKYDTLGEEKQNDNHDYENHPKYIMLIAKNTGKEYNSKTAFKNAFSGDYTVLRLEMVYIPQMHSYTNIETNATSLANYTFSNTDLLCIVPQFNSQVAQSIDVNSVYWEYTNKTTLETIRTDLPIQTPLIARYGDSRLLSRGYWTVTMYYKLEGSNETHTLTKNSAFKIA